MISTRTSGGVQTVGKVKIRYGTFFYKANTNAQVAVNLLCVA